jgi:hypothetical protein
MLVESTSDHPRFEIAHPILTLAERISEPIPLTPSPAPYSSHTVAHFKLLGGLTIRTAKAQKSWKAPGSAPYPNFHKAKSLAEHMDVVLTIQTIKNLEVEIRDAENAIVKANDMAIDTSSSWANPAVRDYFAIQTEEACYKCEWDWSESDDDELILQQAPCCASTPEPAPPSSLLFNDDMDLFADPPFSTPVQKDIAILKMNRNAYNGPCPPSPTAPIIQMDDQERINNWVWEEQQQYRDKQDIINNNTEWLYVPSSPLHANITLMDPSSVDLSEDPVDSSINSCNCTNKIVSVQSDLFSTCAACETKPKDITKWMMDSGTSMAFTSYTEDFSQLTYFQKDK